MSTLLGRIQDLAAGQHHVIAAWQLHRAGWKEGQIKAGLRSLRRVHHGVCAVGDLSEMGWYMAAALAGGPDAAISHLSALMLMELRPYEPRDLDVTVPRGGGRRRDGIVFHRRDRFDTGTYRCVPVTSPTQSLLDSGLEPHELYRALEQAEKLNLPVRTDRLLSDVVDTKRRVRGRTRSDTEARFLFLLHEHGLPLPLVNQPLNGVETDFHWPAYRLIAEVDGFEHHRERRNFNEDRRRGLVHRAAGYELIRISADHVYDEGDLVAAALTRAGL